MEKADGIAVAKVIRTLAKYSNLDQSIFSFSPVTEYVEVLPSAFCYNYTSDRIYFWGKN